MVQKQTPLFIYHGAADQVVPLKYARATKEWLDKKGVTVAHFTEVRARSICNITTQYHGLCLK